MYIFSSGSKSSSSSLLGNSFHFHLQDNKTVQSQGNNHHPRGGFNFSKSKENSTQTARRNFTTTDDEEKNARRVKLKTKAKII